MKLWSAIMGTIYPLSCLHCDLPLAFSYEVLCPECLLSICWDENPWITLSEDIITEQILGALHHHPSKRICEFVASLMILKIAREELSFDSLSVSSQDKVGSWLAKIIARRLKVPIDRAGLKISLSRQNIPVNHLAVVDRLPRHPIIKKVGIVEH